MTVERKPDLDDLPVPARDLQHIGTPPLVRRRPLDAPRVRAPRPPPGRTGQLPPRQLHRTTDPLQVIPGGKLAIDEGPDAPGAVGRTGSDDRADLRPHH